jgi:hypothetical protein
MLKMTPTFRKYAAGATLAIATAGLSGCYYAPAPGYGPRYAYAAPAYAAPAYAAPAYDYSPGYYAAPAYGYAPYGGGVSLSFGGGGGHRHRGW